MAEGGLLFEPLRQWGRGIVETKQEAEALAAEQAGDGEFAAAVPQGRGGEQGGEVAHGGVAQPPPDGVKGVVHAYAGREWDGRNVAMAGWAVKLSQKAT